MSSLCPDCENVVLSSWLDAWPVVGVRGRRGGGGGETLASASTSWPGPSILLEAEGSLAMKCSSLGLWRNDTESFFWLCGRSFLITVSRVRCVCVCLSAWGWGVGGASYAAFKRWLSAHIRKVLFRNSPTFHSKNRNSLPRAKGR